MDSRTRVAQGPLNLVRSGPNNFNTLRLALALLVVWSHSFAIHLGSEESEWVSLLLGGVYNAGNLAVMGFFIISGFLISESWQRSRSLRSYLSKRVRRIYPGYMVATTICALIVAPLFGGAFPNPWTTLGWNLLLQKMCRMRFRRISSRAPSTGPCGAFRTSSGAISAWLLWDRCCLHVARGSLLCALC